MTELSGGIPRDDRAWPPWARPFSVVLVLGSVVVAFAAVATETGSAVPRAVVALAFVLFAVVSAVSVRGTFEQMLAGGGGAGAGALAQVGLAVVGLVLLAVDGRLGVAALAGLVAGLFVVNFLTIRKARANRELVDASEAARDRAPSATAPTAAAAPEESRPPPGEDPRDVGSALEAARVGSRRRWLGWVLATGLVATGTVLLTDSGLARFMVPATGGVFLVWSSLSLAATWRARRDFAAARTSPERAWVVLLSDPAPRMVRPLLGVWRESPLVRGGALPAPDLVFRCDEDLDDLLSHQGSAVVHEAWVDTSSRGMRGARWVAADGGIAVPHHRGLLFGCWYFHAVTRAERPEPPVPLRSPLPLPLGVPSTSDGPTAPGPGAVLRAVGWRAALLGALAVGCVLID